MRHFGRIENIKTATVQELSAIPGMDVRAAKAVVAWSTEKTTRQEKIMNSRENRTEPLCVINIKDFCKEMDLEIVHCEFETFELYDGGINRPGLQLHGYYEYFDASRIQITGKVEMSYLMSLDERLREKTD